MTDNFHRLAMMLGGGYCWMCGVQIPKGQGVAVCGMDAATGRAEWFTYCNEQHRDEHRGQPVFSVAWEANRG